MQESSSALQRFAMRGFHACDAAYFAVVIYAMLYAGGAQAQRPSILLRGAADEARGASSASSRRFVVMQRARSFALQEARATCVTGEKRPRRQSYVVAMRELPAIALRAPPCAGAP